MKRAGLIASLASACLMLTGCTVIDMARLAGDETNGRQNDTAGSATARAYLIEQLRPIARGLNPAGTGDAAYTQAFSGGTNVVAVIPGTDLADEYVVVGAHYDGAGHLLRSLDAPRTGSATAPPTTPPEWPPRWRSAGRSRAAGGRGARW